MMPLDLPMSVDVAGRYSVLPLQARQQTGEGPFLSAGYPLRVEIPKEPDADVAPVGLAVPGVGPLVSDGTSFPYLAVRVNHEMIGDVTRSESALAFRLDLVVSNAPKTTADTSGGVVARHLPVMMDRYAVRLAHGVEQVFDGGRVRPFPARVHRNRTDYGSGSRLRLERLHARGTVIDRLRPGRIPGHVVV